MRFSTGLLLYNEHAGQGKVSVLEEIVPILKLSIQTLTPIVLDSPGMGEKLCADHGEKYDIIVVYGGDGTVHDCINGIGQLKKRPVVAVIPGGTCNDFARTLGVPEDIYAACEFLENGLIKALDVGQINDRFFVNFCGVGLITETSENINDASKQRLGKVSYFVSALETLRQPSFFKYHIKTKEFLLEGEAVLIAVFNGSYIGTVDLPFDIQPNDGSLQLVIVKEGGFPLLKEVLQRQKIKETGEHAALLDHYRVGAFTLTTDPMLDVDMDGEIYTSTPFKCCIKPAYIQFLTSI